MEYLALFGADGHRKASVPCDVTLTDERKQALLSDGYVEITEEDFAYYIGNKGSGKNDTGYIRGKDGKPTDAPPQEPQPQEPYIDEERLTLYEAMAAQEARIVAQEARLSALEAKGGGAK